MPKLDPSDLGLLSVTEYAKHRGVAHPTVIEAIDNEKISHQIIGGKRYVDPDQADKEWNDNSKEIVSASSQGIRDVQGPSYNQSRAIKEAYNARLAKLEYERRKSELVVKADVEKEAFNVARQIRNAFTEMPDRIAPELFSCDSVFEVSQLLRKELDQVLERISKYER